MNTTAINHDDVAAVVRLPRHLYQALRVRAAAEDRTVAALIRIAASEHVGVLLTVSGGTVLLAGGSDGVDSTGSATISDGTVATASSSGGANGALDVSGTLTTPATLTVTTDGMTVGQTVVVTDADGDAS